MKKNKNKKKKKQSPCSLQLYHSIFHEEKINVLKVVASSNPAVATAVDDLESSQICSDGAKPKIEKASTDIGEGKKEKEEEEEDDGQDSPATHCRLQGWEGLIVIAADVTNNITVYTPVEG